MSIIRSIAIVGSAFVASVLAPPVTAAAPVFSPKQQAVWRGEVAYWTYVNARDETRFLALWAPEFKGWPCGMDHPTDFAGLKESTHDWFAEVGATGRVTKPIPEAVVLGNEFAITYLSALANWTDKDGTPRTELFKLVHTWKSTKAGWKIVGGMCRPLERAPAP